MRKTFLIALAVLMMVPVIAEAGKTVRVKGSYNKKTGTYRQPHHRTSPNRTKNDNWSTKGNTNPYTGKEGTKSQ